MKTNSNNKSRTFNSFKCKYILLFLVWLISPYLALSQHHLFYRTETTPVIPVYPEFITSTYNSQNEYDTYKSITIDAASNILAGDVLFAFVSESDATGDTLYSNSTGWSRVTGVFYEQPISFAIFWKRATTNGSANNGIVVETGSVINGNVLLGTISVFRNVRATGVPYNESTNTTITSTTTSINPVITTTRNESLVLVFTCVYPGNQSISYSNEYDYFVAVSTEPNVAIPRHIYKGIHYPAQSPPTEYSWSTANRAYSHILELYKN